jgi:hypothetical protein
MSQMATMRTQEEQEVIDLAAALSRVHWRQFGRVIHYIRTRDDDLLAEANKVLMLIEQLRFALTLLKATEGNQ